MRFTRVLVCFLLLAGPAALAAAQPQPQPSMDEFVPVTDTPESEQIPAFRLVGAAYGFVWVALAGYVWSLGSRLKKVERDLTGLEQRKG